MKKLLPILLFCSILLLTLVSAAPPFQQVAGEEEGLTLRFPPVETIKVGRDITSHMHVYNSTNGLILTNTTVTCFADLYNSTGDHIVKSQMGFDLPYDFQLKIKGGNFTIRERDSFIIWCNSSTAGGLVAGGFDVTLTGREDPEGITKIIFFAFFMILVFGSLFSFLRILGHWKDLEVDILEFAQSIGIYLVVFIFQYLALTYLGDPVINDIMEIFVVVGAITHAFVPTAAFLASLILNPFRRGANQ